MTHAADRALEHHGIYLRPGDERVITWRVKSGKAVLMGKFPDGNERWLVEVRGKVLKVIFNPTCDKIVTIEPQVIRPKGFRMRKRFKPWRRKGRR